MCFGGSKDDGRGRPGQPQQMQPQVIGYVPGSPGYVAPPPQGYGAPPSQVQGAPPPPYGYGPPPPAMYPGHPQPVYGIPQQQQQGRSGPGIGTTLATGVLAGVAGGVTRGLTGAALRGLTGGGADSGPASPGAGAGRAAAPGAGADSGGPAMGGNAVTSPHPFEGEDSGVPAMGGNVTSPQPFESGVQTQIEVHPYLNQRPLFEFCKSHGVAVTAYSPLGSPDRPWAKPGEPTLMQDPRLQTLVGRYRKTAPQLLIRYALDRGMAVIPKSVTASRIADNFAVLDFHLAPEHISAIGALECKGRLCSMGEAHHPDLPFHDEY